MFQEGSPGLLGKDKVALLTELNLLIFQAGHTLVYRQAYLSVCLADNGLADMLSNALKTTKWE